ncbi:MAG: membrane-bound lytic murein transglycosylase MltF [Magnetococcales bacterium]|nr:membrane-bound lytic murein transglycosylase MltF [Magnetococcales bacterium]
MVAIMLTTSGCDLRLERPLVEVIRERGKLIVVTRNSPTTYYEGRDQKMVGFEQELAVAFGQYLGVDVEFKVLGSRQEILDAVRKGDGDLAAAGLARFEDEEGAFLFSTTYQQVDQQVVCRRGGRRPTNLLQLAEVDLVIEEGSSISEYLHTLKGIVPGLTWNVAPELSAEQILGKVWSGDVDCTIADSNIVAINRRYFPELVVKFPMGDSLSLSWILPKHAQLLNREVSVWFQRMKQSGRLEALYERYYGHVDYHHDDYDYVDNRRFLRRIYERLPEYEPIFRSAAKKYQLSWKFLAALSYQESHWEPTSTSFTGVRGMMMLTRATAKLMGVENRLDPAQSIYGGAEYFTNIRNKLPKQIPEPDRTWFALTAYNIGPGHLADARELAVRLGKDPNRWNTLRTVLPLLSQEKYHKTLKRGYARGSEPIRYVHKIRQYLDILERQKKVSDLSSGLG